MADEEDIRGRPPRIAVTGGAGSGKSAVCLRLQALGAFVVDLDRLAREAVAPGTPGLSRVVDRFGREVLGDGGELDRRRLRNIITSNRRAKRDLEAIVHPEVLRQMHRQMDEAESAGATLLVAEVPLLFEAGLQGDFDQVIVVAAPCSERVRRIAKRDAVTVDQAKALIGVQMPEAEKKKRADVVIENRGRPHELTAAVDRLYTRLAATEKGGESA